MVVFTSDNGPWTVFGNRAGSTGPLREAKGTSWDGGIRVPCVMRWPGTIPPGRVSAEPVGTIDLLPTIAKIAGAPLPERKIDGKDIGPSESNNLAKKEMETVRRLQALADEIRADTGDGLTKTEGRGNRPPAQVKW